MKKRIFCLILALVMVLSLAACAGSGNDNTENTKDTTTNTEGSEAMIMMGLRMMLRAPGMFLGALVMAFWMNAELAAVILVVIPLLTAAIVWILRTAYPRFTAMQKALDTLNSGIQESPARA